MSMAHAAAAARYFPKFVLGAQRACARMGKMGAGCFLPFGCRSSRRRSLLFAAEHGQSLPGFWLDLPRARQLAGHAERARSVPRGLAAICGVLPGATWCFWRASQILRFGGEPGQLPGAREEHVVIALSSASVGSAPQ